MNLPTRDLYFQCVTIMTCHAQYMKRAFLLPDFIPPQSGIFCRAFRSNLSAPLAGEICTIDMYSNGLISFQFLKIQNAPLCPELERYFAESRQNVFKGLGLKKSDIFSYIQEH